MLAKRFALDAVSSYGRYLVSFMVAFLLVPVMVQSLGVEDFGLLSLMFSVLGVVGLLDLGFGAAVVKYVAESRGQGSIQRRNEIVSTLLAGYLMLGLVACVAIAGLALVFNQAFSVPVTHYARAHSLLWILGFRMVVLQLPLSLFRGLLFGEQRILSVNVISALSNLAYGAGAALVLLSDMGVLMVAWVSLGVMVLEHVAYIVVAYMVIPNLELSYWAVNRERFWEVSTFSWHQFVCDGAALILLQVDLILVQVLAGLSDVAIYAVALRLASQAHLFCKQFVNTLSPRFAQLSGRNEKGAIGRLFLAATEVAVAPSLVLLSAVLLFGQQGLLLWVGSPFDEAWPLLCILFVAVAVGIPQSVAGNLLANTGYHRWLSRASALSVVANIVLSLSLFPYLGLLGVALGTLLSKLFVDYPLVVAKACRIHNIPFWGFLLRLALGTGGPLIVSVGVMLALRAFAGAESLLGLVLIGITSAASYVAFFLLYRRRKLQPDLTLAELPEMG